MSNISEEEEFEFRLRAEQEDQGSSGVSATTETSEEPSSSNPSSGNPVMDISARIGMAIGRFNEKAAGGAREAIRSIGTGEDAADAYMRGYGNPSQSESLQEGAIQGANDAMTKMGVDKLPYAANVATRFVGGVIPSISGMATDIATNPVELLSIVAFAKFPTLLREVAPGMAEKISKFATNKIDPKTMAEKVKGSLKAETDSIKAMREPKLVEPNTSDVADMIKQVQPEAMEAQKILLQNKNVELANKRAEHATIQNGLQTKVKVLDGDVAPTDPNMLTIPKAADSATTSLRKKYWDYAKDLSERFGKAYEKAIAGESIDTQKLYDALGNAIERDGFLKLPESQWSKSQRSVYDYQQKIKGLIQESRVQVDTLTNQQVQVGSPTVKLSQVDKELQSILQSKKGKAYGSGDHVLTLTREETANAIGETSAKVRDVRKMFAPELQAKNEFTKIVQPFNRSGEFDTTRGTSFFSNYAKGKINPDEARLIEVFHKNPKLGSDMLKPLDNLNLQRNTILRNQLDLQINKPKDYAAINEKYSKLTRTLKRDVAMQRDLLDGMMERAAMKETLSSRIKSFAESSIKGAGYAAGAGAVTGAGVGVYKVING